MWAEALPARLFFARTHAAIRQMQWTRTEVWASTSTRLVVCTCIDGLRRCRFAVAAFAGVVAMVWREMRNDPDRMELWAQRVAAEKEDEESDEEGDSAAGAGDGSEPSEADVAVPTREVPRERPEGAVEKGGAWGEDAGDGPAATTGCSARTRRSGQRRVAFCTATARPRCCSAPARTAPLVHRRDAETAFPPCVSSPYANNEGELLGYASWRSPDHGPDASIGRGYVYGCM